MLTDPSQSSRPNPPHQRQLRLGTRPHRPNHLPRLRRRPSPHRPLPNRLINHHHRPLRLPPTPESGRANNRPRQHPPPQRPNPLHRIRRRKHHQRRILTERARKRLGLHNSLQRLRPPRPLRRPLPRSSPRRQYLRLCLYPNLRHRARDQRPTNLRPQTQTPPGRSAESR